MSQIKDRTNIRYGRLVALELDKEKTKTSNQGAYWLCMCDCGKEVSVRGNTLGRNANSCGCLQKELNKTKPNRLTHGKSHSRLANIWYHMVGRCHNEKDYNYFRYGAKGITVCEDWKADFLKFEEWAFSNGYNEGLSIDRIDPTGNYEPSNCRWATFDTQANNKRKTLWIEFNGERTSLKQAYNLSDAKVTYTTAKARYHKGERNTDILFN